MIRNILAVLAGLAAAILIFVVFEQINHSIFPLQKSGDGGLLLSTQFLLIVILGWAVGSFLAGLIIKKISNSNSYILPIIAGAILTLSGVANLILVKHPLWMQIITIIVFMPFVWLGFWFVKKNEKSKAEN